MTFQESIKTCFNKYADFNERANRSEFWWFLLFLMTAYLALQYIPLHLSTIFSFAVMMPTFAVTTRRLHDINKSGWFLVIGLIWWTVGLVVVVYGFLPLLNSVPWWIFSGSLILLACAVVGIYLLAKPSDATSNQYGAPIN